MVGMSACSRADPQTRTPHHLHHKINTHTYTHTDAQESPFFCPARTTAPTHTCPHRSIVHTLHKRTPAPPPRTHASTEAMCTLRTNTHQHRPHAHMHAQKQSAHFAQTRTNTAPTHTCTHRSKVHTLHRRAPAPPPRTHAHTEAARILRTNAHQHLYLAFGLRPSHTATNTHAHICTRAHTTHTHTYTHTHACTCAYTYLNAYLVFGSRSCTVNVVGLGCWLEDSSEVQGWLPSAFLDCSSKSTCKHGGWQQWGCVRAAVLQAQRAPACVEGDSSTSTAGKKTPACTEGRKGGGARMAGSRQACCSRAHSLQGPWSTGRSVCRTCNMQECM